jgi:hypothetical protein
MKTTAAIVEDGHLIAFVTTALKNGSDIIFAYDFCDEKIDANRSINLVNARRAKISRAKKYHNFNNRFKRWAQEVNPSEFLIDEPVPSGE